MVFSSTFFLFVYLPLVMSVYYIVPLKFRNPVLLIFSLVFYGWGEPVYIILMLLSTILDYTFGLLISKNRDNRRLSKALVCCSVVLNLSLLGFFKYYDFFVLNLAKIPMFSGLEPLGVKLPIGISFYTFQSMSYPIDVYRNDAPVQRNFTSFATFVTVFPQLIAGPIVKYKELAEQLNSRKCNLNKFADGIKIFLIGLSKKVLLANNIGMLWDYTKSVPTDSLSLFMAWLGITAFAFQIYFDFSGYSDMALGLGKMLGFEFPINFNYPYVSQSVTEFWRRWHISLSTWFREYVYIPLGGNRKGKLKTYRNIFLVWALTGFWHGASWNFLLWGIYFAIILILEKALVLDVLKKMPSIIGHIYTIILIWISWTLFAIEDLEAIKGYLLVMLGFSGSTLIDNNFMYYMISFGPILSIAILASTRIPRKILNRLENYKVIRYITPLGCFILLIICTAYLVDSTYNPFLYFRF